MKNIREMDTARKWDREEVTEKIIKCCIAVHKELGPGFLESIYRNALKIEFGRQGVTFESEKEVRVLYQGIDVGIHRLDFLVEQEIVVELKSVEDISGKFYAQVRSYLRASQTAIGLLVNFSRKKIDVRRVEENPGPKLVAS